VVDVAADEPEIVRIAREVRAGMRAPRVFDEAFSSAVVYTQHPEQGGLMVSEVPGMGRWVPVFSTIARLARFAGDGQYQALTGSDPFPRVSW
jgi:hypothetical protein